MCLLIMKPAGKSIPLHYLRDAWEANPHGAGLAWSDGKTVQIEKGADWTYDEIADITAQLEDFPAIVHFRFATHGSLTDKNTHPFRLPGGWTAGHNGVISGVTCKRDESDTRAFLRKHVSPYIVAGRSLSEEPLLADLGKAMGGGNKMAFLHDSGAWSLANPESGHWKDGIWYSNHTYVRYQYCTTERKPWRNMQRRDFHDLSEIECRYCLCHIKTRFALDDYGTGFLCEDCADLMGGPVDRDESEMYL